MIDDLETPAELHDAFVAATVGEPGVEPWTPARKVAAQSMGMLYPLIGDEGMEQLEATGVYPGALRDTIIYEWLVRVARKPSEVLRAQRKPREAWQLAEKWAGESGLLHLAGAKFMEAYKAFSEKMAAEQEAATTPDVPTSAGDADPNV